MKLNFAKRMSYIKASEIREILKVTEQEDVISFAGGLPAPELFPIDEINENEALVQTLDFITPVVDDPYVYGKIAAANSLSDIFAMGAEVKTALNIVGFDRKNHPTKVLGEMLRGGNEKLKSRAASFAHAGRHNRAFAQQRGQGHCADTRCQIAFAAWRKRSGQTAPLPCGGFDRQ